MGWLFHAGTGRKKRQKKSKKLHFFWKKVLRRDFRAVDDLAKGVTCSAPLILFIDFGVSWPVCRMPLTSWHKMEFGREK
ncbi:hypothetical protein [Agrobacterium sp. B1(2019)]|uniref:hypothetical protein n=1 Tax=Agrobacterium sp. B1(2019) TaxID=2607032 RepID=UPI001FEF185C|nr:hypothetical protein [Agrobacterium sp. B1(2019)]